MTLATASTPPAALPADTDPAREQEVFVEQIDLLERNVRNGLASGALSLPIVGYVLYGWSWPGLFWGWVVGILIALGASGLWCWHWRRAVPRPVNARPWGRWITLLSGLLGVAWGMAPILFYQPQPEVAAALLVLSMAILVSGCTGGAAVLGSAIALMVPAAGLFIVAALRTGSGFAAISALIAALMLGLMVFYAFNINHAIVSAIRMRLLNRDLNEALTEQRVHERTRVLEAASRHKSEFLASMSHELRTPLNAIIGYSEMLQEDAVDEGAPALVPDLQKITTSGKHLLELINSVLDLSKIEAGKLELHVEEFELATVLAEVAATAQPLAARNDNRFELICEPGIGRMRADATKLRQVLLNLVGNACKFTEHGRIVLRVSREGAGAGAWFNFAIEDNGIGMTPEQVARLFEDYMQADASTSKKYGGSGLGLALSRRLCRLMGGDITVISDAGHGSTFTARLPSGVAAEPRPQAIPTPVDVANQGPAATATRAGTVLVIDDEAGVRELLQRLLVREGFSVLTAAGGEEGLRLAREHRPDVITLDVMMPGLDGWSVLSRLAADPALSSIPVIMLTMVDEKKTGYALGAADYLTKPVDRARLAAALGKFRRDLPVLVIEGDEGLRGLLVNQLQAEGYAVTEVADGQAALRLLAERAYGAILLDLPTPGMDGFEFVAALAAQPAWRSIPVYIITAQELTPRQRALLHGSVVRILGQGGTGQQELLSDVRTWVGASVGRR